MIRGGQRAVRRAWALGLLGAVLICSSLIATTARLSVRDILLAARDQPIDLLVTAGTDPSTTLAGHPYLAPDAWMTAGLITEEQILQVQAIPGVEVAAPVTVLPTTSKPFGEVASAWIPAEPGADLAWTAEITASTTDGTGTRRTDPRRVGGLVTGQEAAVIPGIGAVSLRDADGQEAVILGEEGYRLAPMTQAGLGTTTYLSSARSFAVAIDPEAEARLARQVGQEDLARSLETLGRLSMAPDAGTLEAAMARLSPPLTRGQPIPALVSTESRGSIRIEATIETRVPGALPQGATNPQATCSAFRLLSSCRSLTPAGAASLEGMEVSQVRTSELSSPILAWGLHGHPYTTAEGGEVVAMSVGPFWDEHEAPAITVLTTLSRRDTTAQGAPSVRVDPVKPAISLGEQWRDEVYRQQAPRPGQVPALSLLAGQDDIYTPDTHSFLPGTSPLSASSLRTTEGAITQTLDATGAATSAAPALVSRQLLATLLEDGRGVEGLKASGASELGATVLRVRLERGGGEPPSDAELERIAARIAQMGLSASVLTGASRSEVAIDLAGSDAAAWHGRATETWTELGAVLRVERATGRALALLPALAVLVVGALALVVERSSSMLRRQEARTLLSAGWPGRSVRRRLLAGSLPGIAVLLACCAAVAVLGAGRAVAHPGPGPGIIVAIGLLACAGTAALAWWDGLKACQPSRIARPRPEQPAPARPTSAQSGPAQSSPAQSAPAPRAWRRLRGPTTRGPAGAGIARSTILAVGRGAHGPGRAAVTLAALAVGALAALAIRILSGTAAQVGMSEAASQGTGVVGAASRLLLLLAAGAAAVILGSGLRDVQRAAARRQRVLARQGWTRRARLGVEAVLWASQFGPLLLLAAALAGLATGTRIAPWMGPEPSAATTSLAWGGLTALAVLLLVALVMARLALSASAPQRIARPSCRTDADQHPGSTP
ncbi:hypothetical protein NSA19_13195 [Actinomyces bowdenii]|uniref:hypothetical protein n=1 Tax=Actinomyces bowdenii TaxID=131109 RepID=UPI00214CE8AE|nr:hypothetical protein [Actinomyces bowdenii]MCR2053773.1 hypothetical protein [Actinomyces bowdenii]